MFLDKRGWNSDIFMYHLKIFMHYNAPSGVFMYFCATIHALYYI